MILDLDDGKYRSFFARMHEEAINSLYDPITVYMEFCKEENRVVNVEFFDPESFMHSLDWFSDERVLAFYERELDIPRKSTIATVKRIIKKRNRIFNAIKAMPVDLQMRMFGIKEFNYTDKSNRRKVRRSGDLDLRLLVQEEPTMYFVEEPAAQAMNGEAA